MAGYVYSGPGYAADVAAGKVQAKSPGMSGSSSGPSSSGSSQTIVTGSGNMKNGTRSSDVASLQQRLNELGYGLATDGIYGAKTEAAVRDYQSKNGLAVDGIVGTNTRGSLNASSGGQTMSPGYYEVYEDEDDGYSRYRDEIEDLMDEIRGLYSGKNSAYDAALEAQKQATAAAVQKATNDLNAQKDETANNYADMYRQLYINKMNSQKNIGQQMAAMGQTGGQAESTLLGLNTSYSDALRQGKQSENNALSALEKAIIDAQLSGSAQDAQATAETAINKANAYAGVLQNLISTYGSLAQAEQAQKNNDREYNYNLAMALMSNGQIPTDDVLSSAGISKDNAAAIIASAATSKASSGAKKSSSGGSKTTGADAVTVAYNAFLNGDRTASVTSTLENYYGKPIDQLAKDWGVSMGSDSGVDAVTTGSNTTVSSINPEYEERAGNYQEVRSAAQQIYNTQGKQAALNFIKECYNGDTQILNFNDYSSLYNLFRNK